MRAVTNFLELLCITKSVITGGTVPLYHQKTGEMVDFRSGGVGNFPCFENIANKILFSRQNILSLGIWICVTKVNCT